MKRLCTFKVVFFLMACFIAKADVPVFGNSPNNTSAFSVGITGDNTFGAAVGFTPLENLSVSSVTLWLSGYNGQSTFDNEPQGMVTTNQSYIIGIYNNYDPRGFNQPGSSLTYLSVPAPNDGSLSPFEFTVPSGLINLEANQEYWVFIYGITMPESNLYDNNSSWVGGGSPIGDAIYDGADSFFFSGQFTPSSDTPAFTINTVPEPRVTAFVSLIFVLGIGRFVGKRITN